MDTDPGYMSRKKSKVSNGKIIYVYQTESLTHATHVNGWKQPLSLVVSVACAYLKNGKI